MAVSPAVGLHLERPGHLVRHRFEGDAGRGEPHLRQAVKPPVLEIRGLTIVRDGTRILRDLDWRVEAGQHWVILGANGSGKTSLLAAL
ncbi:MAG TPA: ATP-binding cassette domain-containing protein, partial [Candidatus Limnocylindria bacterium]|nr:ATP-binding cassette domain-containing protein [Candidatus Limnocylindria bacterium]